MKTLIISLFFFQFLFAGSVFAHEAELAHEEPEILLEAIVEAETVTTSDLGVPDPGTLPTSPFYFFKEWGRGIQRLFTFNSIAKAELELRISNEKAAEAKKIEETKPNDENAIYRALENYQKAHERLQARLESLKETSQNPNVDRLLERLAEKTVQHEKLFEELEEKHESAKSIIQNIRAKIAQTVGDAAEKDTPEKFKARLEKVLEESKGSDFKHIRSIEILDRLSQRVPEDVKEEIEELREELADEVQEHVEGLLDDEQEIQRLKEILEHLPGDLARRAALLHEIRERISAQRVKALDRILDELEETGEMKLDMKARAEEQIHHAQEKVEDLQEEIAEIPETELSQGATALFKEAQAHLESAKKSFEEGKYGEAFGQGRAAEAIARNGLRVLKEASLEPEDLGEELEELAGKISKAEASLKVHGVVKEENPKVFELLENAQKHLGFAKDAFAKNDQEGTKLHMGHVRGFLRDFHQLLAGIVTLPPRLEPVFCIQIYDPVCGVDGKTYSNRCVAEHQHRVKVAHEGECRPTPVPPPTSVTPLIQEITLEADDAGFYPSSEIKVMKGSKVKLTFVVRTSGVYYAGLDFRSSKFNTSRIDPGGFTTVEFTADESFEFKSYWPSSGVLKATGKIIVE